MIGGQSDDIFRDQRTMNKESINSRKTGALIEASLLLGGIIAAGSEEELQALQMYGRTVGLAFQITDDLLDNEAGEELKGRAKELEQEAVNALEVFDTSKKPLQDFAEMITNRKE